MPIHLIPKYLTLANSPMRKAAKNFESTFHEAWARFPIPAQAIVVDYFKTNPGWVYLCFRMDYIVHPEEPFGRCRWDLGNTPITFLAPFFELNETDEPLRAVIGHELTHCYRRGNGTWTDDESVEESQTRAQAKEWGFRELGFGGDAELYARWHEGVEAWRNKNAKWSTLTERKWLGSPPMPFADKSQTHSKPEPQ